MGIALIIIPLAVLGTAILARNFYNKELDAEIDRLTKDMSSDENSVFDFPDFNNN